MSLLESAAALEQDLESCEFSNCELRHEALRQEVQTARVPLNVISTVHLEHLCPRPIRRRRPACPHFTDVRDGNDPLERTMILLHQHSEGDWRQHRDDYLRLRLLLIGIDQAIRNVRRGIHNLQFSDYAMNEALFCEGILRTLSAHNRGELPTVLNNINSLRTLEQVFLQLYEEIRGNFERLTRLLLDKLAGLHDA